MIAAGVAGSSALADALPDDGCCHHDPLLVGQPPALLISRWDPDLPDVVEHAALAQRLARLAVEPGDAARLDRQPPTRSV